MKPGAIMESASPEKANDVLESPKGIASEKETSFD